MLLIGMYDSPFVRRVAVSLLHLDIPFEHANWSVGKDFERIRSYSPLGRVPALVLDDGGVLVESGAILDYLDDHVGPHRALVPASGRARRDGVQLMAKAVGAAEKGRETVYERVMRPPEKYHGPWVARCLAQMHGALAELEAACQRAGKGAWLVADRYTQADITLACMYGFVRQATSLAAQGQEYTALDAHLERCESRPEFQATREAWSAPSV